MDILEGMCLCVIMQKMKILYFPEVVIVTYFVILVWIFYLDIFFRGFMRMTDCFTHSWIIIYDQIFHITNDAIDEIPSTLLSSNRRLFDVLKRHLVVQNCIASLFSNHLDKVNLVLVLLTHPWELDEKLIHGKC